MAEDSRKKLRRVTIVFWVLLFYIIAALLWWLLSLEQQNETIHALKRHMNTLTTPVSPDVFEKIDQSEKKESIKYIAEGVTFLLLIIFGAAYIYRLVRRQFRVQQQQQNFVMGVTHELKTPLSVVRLNLETLQKHQLETEKQKKIIQSSLDETIRLDTLINNILISSELDTPSYVVAKEKVDLSSLVNEAAGEFGIRHPNRQLEVDITEGIDINGDPLLLKLLVSNLLENAQKYSPAGTLIRCLLTTDNRTRLCIIDEGNGIPDEEKKKIFDKFYRVGSEETRKTKGTGLGLFICSKIAQYHSARITVTDNHPRGTNFTVSF